MCNLFLGYMVINGFAAGFSGGALMVCSSVCLEMGISTSGLEIVGIIDGLEIDGSLDSPVISGSEGGS